MAFNGTEGSPIAIDVASAWTANYRAGVPGAVKAVFFGKDILNQILSQEGCMGIRMYYAITETGARTLVLVGADANENDQISGTIADFGTPCPMSCSNANPLNT